MTKFMIKVLYAKQSLSSISFPTSISLPAFLSVYFRPAFLTPVYITVMHNLERDQDGAMYAWSMWRGGFFKDEQLIDEECCCGGEHPTFFQI